MSIGLHREAGEMYFRGCLHIQIFVTSKFLGIDISNNLSCAQHILHAIAKKAQQCLYFLIRLKRFVLFPDTLTNYYRCTGMVISKAWYGNFKRRKHNKSHQSSKKVKALAHLLCLKMTASIIEDPHRPAISSSYCDNRAGGPVA